MVFQVHRFFLDSESGANSLPSPYASKPVPAPVSDASAHPFWPEFPHSGAGMVQSSVINGIRVITEQWNCGASEDDVLSYYRDQMAARGWEDTTKQMYNLQPELNAFPDDTEKGEYINNYRNVTDSTLILDRDDWSLRISTEPAKEGFHQITVRFYAAQTSSIMDIAGDTMASLIPKRGQKESPLDVVQKSNGDNYHTTISTKAEPPKEAFRDALADAVAEGWRPALLKPEPRGYFAWLVKGKQYGALSVMDEDGRSTVTLVEVTPK